MSEEVINGIAIPTFDAAHRACADENCTAIQHLIYAYEPAGEEAGAFRWAVAEALREHEGEMPTLLARAEKAEAECGSMELALRQIVSIPAKSKQWREIERIARNALLK